MIDDDEVAFIEGRRGQAGQPAWRRAAPLAALLARRRSLARRLAGDHAPVGGDATQAEERHRAAMMRPAGVLPLCMLVK